MSGPSLELGIIDIVLRARAKQDINHIECASIAMTSVVFTAEISGEPEAVFK